MNSNFLPVIPALFFTVKKAFLKLVITLGLVGYLCFGMSACASPPTITFDPVLPPKEIVVCAQLGVGIPDSVYNAGLQLVKQNLHHVVRPSQGPITFYLVKMSSQTTDSGDILVAGQISAVKPLPHEPSNLSPFLDPTTKKQILAQYAQLQHEAQNSLGQSQAQAQQITAEIMQHDAKHESADIHEGVDVTGCLVQADRLFSKQPGVERHILLISDIEEGSNASHGVSLQLQNVLITDDFLYDDPAKDVYDRQQAFRQQCMRAGAASVVFVDSKQVGLLTGVFGQ